MKSTYKHPLTILLIVFMALSLVGCSTYHQESIYDLRTHVTISDVEDYVTDTLHITSDFTVTEAECLSPMAIDEDLKHQYYRVTISGDNNLEFYVVDKQYYTDDDSDKLIYTNEFATDYYDVLLKSLLDTYPKETQIKYLEGTDYPGYTSLLFDVGLYTYFKNASDLETLMDDMAQLDAYIQKQVSDSDTYNSMHLSVKAIWNYVPEWNASDPPAVDSTTGTDILSDQIIYLYIDELTDKDKDIEHYWAQYHKLLLLYQVPSDDLNKLSEEDIKEATKVILTDSDRSQYVSIINEDSSTTQIDTLLAHSDKLQLGGLYKVATTAGLSVQGDAYAFTITSPSGDIYEFSYDYIPDIEGYKLYYKKNGEIQYCLDNGFTAPFIQENFGVHLNIEDVPKEIYLR